MPPRLLPSALAGLCALLLAPAAHALRSRRPAPRTRLRAALVAPGPAPLTAALDPSERSWHWRLTLRNPGPRPLPVLLDRRLVRLEVTPPVAGLVPPEPTTTSRRRAPRAPRTLVCHSPGAPTGIDGVHTAVIAPGEDSRVIFDPRELCGPRAISRLAAGSTVTLTYGFAGAASVRRSIVLERNTPPYANIAATPVTLNALPVVADAPDPPATPARPAMPGEPAAEVQSPSDDAELRFTGGQDAARPEGVSFNVRVVGRSPFPAWVFFRPGMVRVDVESPFGERNTCSLSRGYAPVRDFFVPLRRGGGPSMSLNLARQCDPALFAQAGIYRVRATFESNIDGEPWRLRSWTGSLRSRWLDVRISRLAPNVTPRPLTE